MAEIALFSLRHALALANEAENGSVVVTRKAGDHEVTYIISRSDGNFSDNAMRVMREYIEKWGDVRIVSLNARELKSGRTAEEILKEHPHSKPRGPCINSRLVELANQQERGGSGRSS